MGEKEVQFTVMDRRKFTPEGELRESDGPGSEAVSAAPASDTPPPQPERPASTPAVENAEDLAAKNDSHAEAAEDGEGKDDALPEPTTEETERQSRNYAASSRQLDDMLREANPGAAAGTAMTFDRLVQSLYMTAAVQMGAGTPSNEQPHIDILGARQSIDMLSVLEEKTKGNISEDEKRLLQNALFDLRMSFLEITNAIASSAQKAPNPRKVR